MKVLLVLGAIVVGLLYAALVAWSFRVVGEPEPDALETPWGEC